MSRNLKRKRLWEEYDDLQNDLPDDVDFSESDDLDDEESFTEAVDSLVREVVAKLREEDEDELDTEDVKESVVRTIKRRLREEGEDLVDDDEDEIEAAVEESINRKENLKLREAVDPDEEYFDEDDIEDVVEESLRKLMRREVIRIHEEADDEDFDADDLSEDVDGDGDDDYDPVPAYDAPTSVEVDLDEEEEEFKDEVVAESIRLFRRLKMHKLHEEADGDEEFTEEDDLDDEDLIGRAVEESLVRVSSKRRLREADEQDTTVIGDESEGDSQDFEDEESLDAKTIDAIDQSAAAIAVREAMKAIKLREEDTEGEDEEVIDDVVEEALKALKLREQDECDPDDEDCFAEDVDTDDAEDDFFDDEDEALEEALKFTQKYNALLEGTDGLTADFKRKSTSIFESAVKDQVMRRVAAYRKRVDAARLKEARKTADQLAGSIDKYLSYALNEWFKQNRPAIDQSLNLDLYESFTSQLKDLFEKNYIDVRSTKRNIVKEKSAQLSQVKENLNREIEKTIKLQRQNEKLKKQLVIAEEASDLSVNQREKLKSLMESSSYGDDRSFRQQVRDVKESRLISEDRRTPRAAARKRAITESMTRKAARTEDVSPQMASYMKFFK